MTDVTVVDDIVVAGQRRRPGGAFPSRSGGGGTSIGDTPGPTIHEAGDDPEPPPYVDPCANPDTALDWNADAAAAEAKRLFEAKAAEFGDDGLYQREFHVYIIRDADGRIGLGQLAWGERVGTNSQSMVRPNETGVNGGNIVGEAHNHPGGGLTPSGSDWDGFDYWVTQITNTDGPAAASRYRQYIIARDVTDPASDFAIRAYDGRSLRTDQRGPEVNPDGLPCP